MGIRFLGTPIEQFEQLCKEEEIVVIRIETFKTEEFAHADGSVTRENVKTGGYGTQIKSWKDIFQFDYDKEMQGMNTFSRESKENLR